LQSSNGAGAEAVDREHVEHLISELKRRSEELEHANRELRRVSHYRSLFLARMSHELRTPLTSILGFAEILLEQEALTDLQRRYCQKIQDSGRRLQTSLEQLVDLSRVETGRTELFLQEFSLPDTLKDSCVTLSRLAQKHSSFIDFRVAPELGNIVSDQGRLRQILYSFLAWCISRSHDGQTVTVTANMAAPSTLRLTFTDEGPRVADPLAIFDPKDPPCSSDLPNIDELGLIVGRRLIEIMGGTVVIDNQSETGVNIIVDLPSLAVREIR